MRFPGYCIEMQNGELTLSRRTFDETELDPATDWKTALQNQEGDFPQGFVDPTLMAQELCRLAIGGQASALVGALDSELTAGRAVAIMDMAALAAVILHCLRPKPVMLEIAQPENAAEQEREIPFA